MILQSHGTSTAAVVGEKTLWPSMCKITYAAFAGSKLTNSSSGINGSGNTRVAASDSPNSSESEAFTGKLLHQGAKSHASDRAHDITGGTSAIEQKTYLESSVGEIRLSCGDDTDICKGGSKIP